MDASDSTSADDYSLPELPDDDDDISPGEDPLYLRNDQLNPNVYAAAS